MMMLPLLPVDCCYFDKLLLLLSPHYPSPTLTPQDNAVGSWLTITILIIFAVAVTDCYAVPMLILQDDAAAFTAG